MDTIVLLTQDNSLWKELSSLLPKSYALSTQVNKKAFIFLDLDSMKASSIRELSSGHLVVAVTRQKRTEPVMEAATAGAYEILHRPLRQDAVHRVLEELQELERELRDFVPVTGAPPQPTCVIVGQSPLIMDVCKKLARLALVDTPVLITGETGTGKELIAESIAQLSSRFGKPFVVVNCAAVPETMIEAELFGFEKGSFTGAVASKEGILRIADEGTVFFDEIGELPLTFQGKLLRFLQTQTFYPLGSTKEIQVNVRVISATNRDLSTMVREGRFRSDLYHRLSVTSIHTPSLRERKKDIPSLIYFFINKYRHTAPRPIHGISKAYLKKMVSNDWPGNIRELENVIRSSLALSKTHYLTTQELKEMGSRPLTSEVTVVTELLASALIPFIKEAMGRKEKNTYELVQREVDNVLFEYVLSATKENQSEAARILGISRLTLRKKLGMTR
jgi:DNA-binding NtrC family response regulator